MVTPCMVIINNFSNKIIIGKFVQVISKQKHPSQLGVILGTTL